MYSTAVSAARFPGLPQNFRRLLTFDAKTVYVIMLQFCLVLPTNKIESNTTTLYCTFVIILWNISFCSAIEVVNFDYYLVSGRTR